MLNQPKSNFQSRENIKGVKMGTSLEYPKSSTDKKFSTYEQLKKNPKNYTFYVKVNKMTIIIEK